MAGKPVVLFLSTKNESRSQIAEAMLRKYAGDRLDVYSAGLEAGQINLHTKHVLNEAGVSFEGQTAKDCRQYLGKLDVRFLITMSSGAEERGPTVFPGALYYFHWHLPDPELNPGSDDEQMARYRALRDRIEAQVKEWLEGLGTGRVARRQPAESSQQV